MLEITIPATEAWDSKNEEFVTINETKLLLEHSLVSISKWEEIWEKPFLNSQNLSYEEAISYVKCMTLNEGIDENVYRFIDKNIFKQIDDYMGKPMTATKIYHFGQSQGSKSKPKIMTNEEIYYYMITLGIYKECENWHINRLFMLMEVFSVKNTPPKELSQDEVARRYHEMNKARKEKMKQKG